MGRNKGSPTWRWKHTSGYVCIVLPEHPFCDKRGRVFEHRLVMEKYLGRYLTSGEVVHHINGVKNDNRIENLKIFDSNSDHIRQEWEKNPNLSNTIFKSGEKPKDHRIGCPCLRCSPGKIKEFSFKKGNPPPVHKLSCKCFRCTKIPPNRKSIAKAI